MALRAGYYGVKRFLRNKLETIAGTYDDTIKNLFPRSEQSLLGTKNQLKITATTSSGDGITYTVNRDNKGNVISIVPTGTATANSYKVLWSRTEDDPLKGLKKGVRYKLTGDKGLGAGNGYIYVNYFTGSTRIGGAVTGGTGGVEFVIPEDADNIDFGLAIYSGKTPPLNFAFYPMVSLASDPDDAYVPYAMTNLELTNSAADQKTAINAIITAATGAADFAAFKTAMGAITPVTRSLSLTKEDITEEVKEDVEPERTVTKKRTTKKTEEV